MRALHASVAVLLLGLVGCAQRVQVDVRGQGVVSLDDAGCAPPGCVLPVVLPVMARAQPDPGHHFASWGGQCRGVIPFCAVTTTTPVTAGFDVNRLEVRVRGAGKVVAREAARECDARASPCVWTGLEPQTLLPVPFGDALFRGLSGDCRGAGRCQLAHGVVQADFEEPPNTLRLEFVGGGAGVVSSPDGLVRCTASCSLPWVPGLRAELTATPSPASFFDGFDGACSGRSCVVTDPGTVQVRFGPGRWLRLALDGTGRGRVVLDGGVVCPGACEALVRTDRPTVLELRPDDTARPAVVEPACLAVDGQRCTVSDRVPLVTVRFDSVLRWSRAFGVWGPGLYDPVVGYSLAQTALPAATGPGEVWVALEQRDTIVLDGELRLRPSGTINGTGLLVSLALDDGALRGVVSLPNPDGGISGAEVQALYEVPDAGVLAVGRCAYTIQDLPCPTGAFALLLRDGGVVARQAVGATPGTIVRGAGFDELGRPLVTFSAAGMPTSPVRGLYRLAPTLDAPAVPVFLHQELSGFCGRGPRGTRCLLTSLVPCGLPAPPPGVGAEGIVDLDALGCRVVANYPRGSGASGNVWPMSATFPPLMLHAASVAYGEPFGAVDAGSFTAHWWGVDSGVDAVVRGEPVRGLSNILAGTALRMQARVLRGGPLTGVLNAGPSFFGRPTGGAPAFLIAVWDSERRAVSKVWPVTGEILSGNVTLSADDRGAVLVVIGRDLKFDGRSLAPDPQNVFQHVLFFDDR